MKIKSSPILGTIGLLFGIFAGAVMGHTATKDHYESVKPEIVTEYVVKEITIQPPQPKIEEAVAEEIKDSETSLTTKKEIPSDPEKRCPKWENELRERGFPVKLFSYIMWRESRCNPKAHNKTLNRDGSQDRGLLQINSTWKTVTKNICGTDLDGLFDSDCNLKVAKYLYDTGGPGHWSM